MSKPIRSHMFRFKRWKIIFEPRIHDHGATDYPDKKEKEIRLKNSKNVSEFDQFETIIHEGLHACFWDIREDPIEQSAHDITRLLWRLGYRKVE